jgi:hypothetical protein
MAFPVWHHQRSCSSLSLAKTVLSTSAACTVPLVSSRLVVQKISKSRSRASARYSTIATRKPHPYLAYNTSSTGTSPSSTKLSGTISFARLCRAPSIRRVELYPMETDLQQWIDITSRGFPRSSQPQKGCPCRLGDGTVIA